MEQEMFQAGTVAIEEMVESNCKSIGPYGDAAGVHVNRISGEIQLRQTPTDLIRNGLILEMKAYAGVAGISLEKLSHLVVKLFHPEEAENVNIVAMNSKIFRCDNNRKSKRGAKLKQYLDENFSLPISRSQHSSLSNELTCTSVLGLMSGDSQNNGNTASTSDLNIAEVLPPAPGMASVSSRQPIAINDSVKSKNLFQYECQKKEKVLQGLAVEICAQKLELENLTKEVASNKTVAVKKRWKTAVAMNRLLRIRAINRRRLHEKALSEKQQVIDDLQTKLAEVTAERDSEKQKKLNALKLKHHYRQNWLNLKKQNLGDHKVIPDNTHHCDMVCSMDTAQDLDTKVKLKNDNGTYTNNFRLCCVEIIGHEVATEKVSGVISTVSERIFGQKLDEKSLPKRQTVQNFADEAHYIIKKMYGDQLTDTTHFGINKDATQRKKTKIMETSLTLGSGQVVPLGFRRRTHEAATDIADNTKRELQELSEISGSDIFLVSALEKLGYFMNDRAANEKKANELLNDWRNEMLQASGSEAERHTVLSLGCMAHVLLGFSRYVQKEMTIQQTELEAEGGKIGRDAAPRFARFSHAEAAVRIIRMVSELLGPVGDWKNGIKDIWEGACDSHNVRSLISNYKDNRFNGTFQCAAEMIHHLPLLNEVLTKLKAAKHRDNGKVISALEDISDPRLVTLVQALAVVYIQVTAPYWNLVNSNVPYLELYNYIQPLFSNLTNAKDQPEMFLDENFTFIPDFPTNKSSPLFATCFTLHHPECRELLLRTFSVLSKGLLNTITAQLVDFLPNGKFSVKPSEADLARTANSHLHNLASEHHFGDLDASQKRRPNATLHHHSNVHLIKRNRLPLRKWFESKSEEEQTAIWNEARRHGKPLRKKHREEELAQKRIQMEEYQSLGLKTKVKQAKASVKKATKVLTARKRTKRARPQAPIPEVPLPYEDGPFKGGEWVAVAYSNNCWYPGYLDEDSRDNLPNTEVTVKFFNPTNRPKIYIDKSASDVRRVELRFIFARIKPADAPVPVGTGRYFQMNIAPDLQKMYDDYYRKFFK